MMTICIVGAWISRHFFRLIVIEQFIPWNRFHVCFEVTIKRISSFIIKCDMANIAGWTTQVLQVAIRVAAFDLVLWYGMIYHSEKTNLKIKIRYD